MAYKFKLQVRLCSEQYYYVEYAYYRLVPIWRQLQCHYAFDYADMIDDGLSAMLVRADEIDAVKAKFDTIEKVRAYEADVRRKLMDWRAKNKEWKQRVAPFGVKRLVG